MVSVKLLSQKHEHPHGGVKGQLTCLVAIGYNCEYCVNMMRNANMQLWSRNVPFYYHMTQNCVIER